MLSVNQRNPEFKQSSIKDIQKLKITDFAKALALNKPHLYEYILLMVKGKDQDQESYSQYIFSHLKNVIKSEFMTNILKHTSRFIITLILMGNLHIYERFAKYLLPTFIEKIREKYSFQMKPVWPLQQFCTQILFLLASWLPLDFYDDEKPSIFVKVVNDLEINCQQFSFINIDKIIISYRILKSLKLDKDQGQCECQKCLRRFKQNRFGFEFEGENMLTRKNMRQKLYILKNKEKYDDEFWKTGFQIELSEQMSELNEMLDQKLRKYQGQGDSVIFYRLREKIDLLEDHLENLKTNYQKLERKKKKQEKDRPSLPVPLHPEKYEIFITPEKNRKEEEDNISTAEKQDEIEKEEEKEKERRSQRRSRKTGRGTFGTLGSSQNQLTFSTPLRSLKSLPDIDLEPLECQFNYRGHNFFQSKVALSSRQMQKFKHSLLCFDQKIYLRKQEGLTVHCLALSRRNTIKVRIIFNGSKQKIEQTQVKVVNSRLNVTLNQDKYEYTIKLQDYFQPIELCCFDTERERENRIILPVGYVKLLQPLPDSAKETEKLTFRLFKTVKLENQLVESYEYLVGKLSLLEKTLDKIRSNKVTRLFEGQKLKKKLERRYLLLGSELILKITNNKTQYIDLQIFCEDRSMHRLRCCQLLKELIFICSS